MRVRAAAGLSVFALMVGCTTIETFPSEDDPMGSTGDEQGTETTGFLPTGPEDPGGTSTGSESGSDMGADTDDSIQPPDVSPPDCDDLAIVPQLLPTSLTELGTIQALATHPNGEATLLVGDSIVHLSVDGEHEYTLELGAGLSPTTLAGDGVGNLFVAGTLDVTLEGDVHGFVRRYVGQQLARHTKLALESGANERPVSLVAATGYVAVLTSVEYDALSAPGLEDFHRVDRLTAALDLVASEPLGPYSTRLALDDEGTAYILQSGDVLALGLDGEALWTQSITATGGMTALSAGGSSLWLVRRNTASSSGGGIRSFDRTDGTPQVALDFEVEEPGAFLESPAAVAAHPCGGATVLLTATLEREPSEPVSSISLSYISSDGIRDTVPVPVVPNTDQPVSWNDPFLVSTAASGSSVALFPVDPGHQLLGF